MKVLTLLFLFAVVALVKCYHMFVGTSIKRPVVFARNQQFPGLPLEKRVENLCYEMPKGSKNKFIQGILAYDLTHSCARVTVTKGGIGASFVNLQLESGVSQQLNYEICIYG